MADCAVQLWYFKLELAHPSTWSGLLFLKGIFCCLPALRGCTEQIVRGGSKSLFWKDKWLKGRSLMNIWHDLFSQSDSPNGTIRELIYWIGLAPFREDLEVGHFLEEFTLRGDTHEEDFKW